MKQNILHKGGLIALLAMLGMTAPLSTDMYLPAFPSISEELSTTSSLVSLTLVVFNVFLAIGVLWFGPISDKYGRKPPLIASLILYAIGNLICFASLNIYILLAGRVIQSFGGGGMISLSLAIVKDSYSSKERSSIIAILQSFTIIGPIIAPILGAGILQIANWHFVFFVLFVISVIEIIMTIMFKETLPENEVNHNNLWLTFERIFVVAKNKKFSILLLIASLYFAAFFAYLTCASFIYEDFFGKSEVEFSIYFAINATLSLAGPILSVWMERKLKLKLSMNLMFIFGFISTIMVFMFGHTSALAFLLSFVIYGIANSVLRPYTTNALLNLHDGDSGSASALINFVFTIFGALGMYIGSMPFPTYVLCVAFSMLIFIGTAFVIWVPTSLKIKS